MMEFLRDDKRLLLAAVFGHAMLTWRGEWPLGRNGIDDQDARALTLACVKLADSVMKELEETRAKQ